MLMGVFFTIITKANDNQTKVYIQNITKLTKLPGIALSTSYLQNRIIYYDDYSNKLYPQMKNYSQTDFVYAK